MRRVASWLLYMLVVAALPNAAAAQVQSVGAGAGDLVSLSITAVVNPKYPPSMANIAYVGDTIAVQGRGFIGATSGLLIRGEYDGGGGFRPGAFNPQFNIPVATFGGNASKVNFIVPGNIATSYIGPSGRDMPPYFVVVIRGARADTSKKPIYLGLAEPVRRITSVEQSVVRAGGRIKVHGIGFNFRTGVDGYMDAYAGYFGNGAPGTSSNPAISLGNQRDDYVELWLPTTCDQDGILMLASKRVGGGSDALILGSNPIRVGCAQGTPKGAIVGSEATANGAVPFKPGETVNIQGTDLRYVTKVIDQQGNSYPFKFYAISTFERLAVTLPGPKPDGAYALQFFLENVLTDPVLAGTVDGVASVMSAPTWSGISPAWAEPGQQVTVRGREFSYSAGDKPTVTVGGVAAQVTKFDALTVEFRLGAATTGGPIAIQNQVGSTQLTGPFRAASGAQHPGFFVVGAASVVQKIATPQATLADGDIVVITGQNLARLMGICVLGSGLDRKPAGSMVELKRIEYGSSTMSDLTTNTEMKVKVPWAANLALGKPVQILAPTAPPVGAYGSSAHECSPNGASVIWPIDPAAPVVVAPPTPPPAAPPADPPPSPPPAAPPAAPPASTGPIRCAGGCFDASGTNDGKGVTLKGPAVVNVDDGSRWQLVLGKLETRESYVSFARDPGGAPKVGTYAVVDQCSESPKAAGAGAFSAEFVTRAYEADATSYLSAGGSLIIERAGEGRFAGRFTIDACWHDQEGKRHDVRLRGTFDAAR